MPISAPVVVCSGRPCAGAVVLMLASVARPIMTNVFNGLLPDVDSTARPCPRHAGGGPVYWPKRYLIWMPNSRLILCASVAEKTVVALA